MNGIYTKEPFDSADDLWEYLSPTQQPTDPQNEFIYRGHANAAWKLAPKIFRQKTAKLIQGLWGDELTAQDQAWMEFQMLQIFVQCCDAVGVRVPNDSVEFRRTHLCKDSFRRYWDNPTLWPSEDLLQVMALARLHGLPARLLDWTTNPYVAVYFAASNAMRRRACWKDGQNLAVWKWNLGPSDEIINGHRKYGHTRVLSVPGSISDNIVAQRGLFTVHPLLTGKRDQPPATYSIESDDSISANTPLQKLTVAVTESVRLYHLCELIDVNAASLYPGTDGVCMTVMDRLRYARARENS